MKFSIRIAIPAILLLCYNSFLMAQTDHTETVMIRRLTNVIDSYPMLSPDGKWIAFQSNRSGVWNIYTIRPDGSGIVNLTHSPGPDYNPIWSPDGTKIVFASERDRDSEIYVMNADGSGQTRLTFTPGDDSHPHWFPDGSRIIFNSARTTPDLSVDWGKQYLEIFSMNADGSDVKQITSFKTISTFPSVSPDGKKIVFRMVTNSESLNWDLSPTKRNSEIFVMDIDGSNLKDVSESPGFDGWPFWSPDSKRIVFSSNRNGPANVGQLFIVNADGSGLTPLTRTDNSYVQPNWAIDGKKILAYQCWETSVYEYGNIVEIDL